MGKDFFLKKHRLQFVEEFSIKYVKLSSSTVHNIIQRFTEPGEISVGEGQSWKSIPDACDLRAL